MKKEYLVVVAALVLLGIGAFFSSRSISDGRDQGYLKSVGGNVTYTNSGFSPETLTVDLGATVIFTDQSNNLMWVASDPHPVHSDYLAFDQVGAENTYSFTFTEASTYKYHNHLVPSDVGAVIVE